MLWPQYRNELSLHFTLEFEFKRLTPKANFSHMVTDQDNIFTAKVYYFPTVVLYFTFAEEEDTFLSRSWSFLRASPKFINFGSSSHFDDKLGLSSSNLHENGLEINANHWLLFWRLHHICWREHDLKHISGRQANRRGSHNNCEFSGLHFCILQAY